MTRADILDLEMREYITRTEVACGVSQAAAVRFMHVHAELIAFELMCSVSDVVAWCERWEGLQVTA